MEVGKARNVLRDRHWMGSPPLPLATAPSPELEAAELVEALGDAIVAVDEGGSIVAFNPAAEQMFGYTRAQALGASLDLLGTFEHTRATGARRDGSEFPVEVTTGALRGGGMVLSMRDGTLRQDALRAHRMEAVRQLATGVAHEFTNLLMGIRGCASILVDRLPTESEVRPLMQDVEREAQRGAELARRLSVFVGGGAGWGEPVAIDEVVRAARPALRSRLPDEISLRVKLRAGTARVPCSATELEELLVHLTSNAIDAMPAGGKLVLQTSGVSLGADDPSRPPRLAPGGYVALTVADTGGGMSLDVLERAWEPFFTTKGPGFGVGLGLAVVYGIVARAGGAFRIESAPGRGTAAVVYLPCYQAPRAGAPVRTVLVVEDERLLLVAIKHQLEEEGFTVLGAESGDAALRLIEDESVDIDLLLTDVVMPGMSGPELAARTRLRRPELPIVFMSGYDRRSLVVGGMIGAHETKLRKPFDDKQLLECVHAHLLP